MEENKGLNNGKGEWRRWWTDTQRRGREPLSLRGPVTWLGGGPGHRDGVAVRLGVGADDALTLPDDADSATQRVCERSQHACLSHRPPLSHLCDKTADSPTRGSGSTQTMNHTWLGVSINKYKNENRRTKRNRFIVVHLDTTKTNKEATSLSSHNSHQTKSMK